MATWNEADHPRDDEGKFTYKGGGTSTSSNDKKMQNRADTLYPTMSNKQSKDSYNDVGLGRTYTNKTNKELSREDILYPSMKSKKDEGELTGGAANLHQKNKEYVNELKSISQNDSDKNFLNSLDYILDREKGYNNIKGDKPTNLGVTQDIYNTYRKENGLSIQDVKKINIDEATQIYYKYFWKPSGANNLQHPLDLAYFDMYINSNPKDAKKVLARSHNDVYEFIENRRKFYDDVIKAKPIKEKFRKGWNNRLDFLKQYADEYYSKKR